MHTTGTHKRLLKIQNLLKIAIFCVVGTKMCNMCAHKKNFGGPKTFCDHTATPQSSKMPKKRPQKKLSFIFQIKTRFSSEDFHL